MREKGKKHVSLENSNTYIRSELTQEQGGFAAVPHEMTELLSRPGWTAEEYRIIFFLIREIQGYQLREKIIKTEKFLHNTGMLKQNFNSTIKSLIAKGAIIRVPVQIKGQKGNYLYRFNEEAFGRVTATKEVKNSYVEAGKVIHINHFRSSKGLPQGNSTDDPKVIHQSTIKTPKPLVVKETQPSKEILNKTKEILRREIGDCFNNLSIQEAEEKAKKEKTLQRKKIMEQVELLKAGLI